MEFSGTKMFSEFSPFNCEVNNGKVIMFKEVFIYFFQCRPITVSEVETEEELIHEFDSPATCDYQWWTTANIRYRNSAQ